MDSLRDLEQYVNGAVAHFRRKMQDGLGQNIDMGLFDMGSDSGFVVQIENVHCSGT